jgi:hypothetical protein
VELPKDDSVSAEHHQDDEYEAQYQTGTYVESIGTKGFLFNAFYPTAEFCRSVTLHRFLSSYR